MAVLAQGTDSEIVAPKGARRRHRRRTIDGPRFIWWNFVSSRKHRIEQAKKIGPGSGWGTSRGSRMDSLP
jgi:redox-sensitive bicupin YhaK (pirin superfamily)